MTITSAQRRRQDALRQSAVRVARASEGKLLKYRSQAVRNALRNMGERIDRYDWDKYVDSLIDESAYILPWHRQLVLNAGLPVALHTTRVLTQDARAKIDAGAFAQRLTQWSEREMGSRIVSVSGTLKDSLRDIIRREIDADANIGVEKLTQNIYRQWRELAEWQVRRIAQTEVMCGLAEATQEAAETLDITYTKTWCCSGLPNSREAHIAMDGVTVGQRDLFELPSDPNTPACVMRYPHDTMYNPPAGAIINCACTMIPTPQ